MTYSVLKKLGVIGKVSWEKILTKYDILQNVYIYILRDIL